MYHIGDKVVHPMHGAGVIADIVTRKISSSTMEYYILNIPVGNITVMIPVLNSDEIGVRPVVSKTNADALIQQIPDLSVEFTQNWNQRYRENMFRIKSGELLEVAKVVKSLLERDLCKGLSTGERKMMHSARQILVSELVLATATSEEHIYNALDSVGLSLQNT